MIIVSDYRDPHLNLAIEEMLMRQAPDKPVLFLWRSLPAVIIGKNQNPWKECDLEFMESMHMTIARRISGGGAVYHDPGNLNCCLITQRTAYNPDDLSAIMHRAIASLGMEASRGGNSLFIRQRKISGSAYCLQKNMALHHCTLLVSADLDALRRALTPHKECFDSKAVESIPSPVASLKDFLPGITMDQAAETIRRSFGDSRRIHHAADICQQPDFRDIYAKHRSWDWTFGHTPRFSVERGGKSLTVEHGMVTGPAGAGSLIGKRFPG